jgi:ATP-dependent helicase HrpB
MRALARIERVAAQWRKQLNVRVDNIRPDAYEVGALVMLAYPDRIAQTRDKGTAYRLANGRGVQLAQTDALAHAPWLAVAHLDGAAGAGGSNAGDIGRIFLAAPLHEDDLKPLTTEHEVLGWDAKQGILVARHERRVGELVLSSQPSAAMSPAKRAQVLCDVVRSEGLSLLNWTEAARQWQARVQSLRLWRGEAWPDVSDEALLARLEDWLLPYLDKVSKRDDFARLDVLSMISALLPWAAQNQLAALAPTHLDVPSGSSIALEYAAGAPPVLAVKLQEMFGLADTPTVNEGRTKVMLHLLSPARQPIQVTQDLRSFWANTYPVVRKELRGRYNKHPWPEDPWNAPPTRKTVKALARG